MTDSGDKPTGPESQGDPEATGKKGLNPLQVISSVLAASLGVQSSKNRERDFKQGRAGVFIAAGIIFTLLFIGTVFTVVQLVLKGAGH
ncbi:MAG: DUF2970 domain-containing protein [Gammaproteobacteria bacterium]|jgi:hypothetical protein|nr:DUF2970 domain-containing protein [Gammaproteobacteria bacterium]